MPKPASAICTKSAMTRIARLSIETRVDSLLEEAAKQLSPDRALTLYLEAKPLAESIHYLPAMLTCAMRIAACYGQLGEYEKAFDSAFLAKELLKHSPDKKSEAALMQTLGTIHWSLCNYEEALKHLYTCIDMASEVNHTILMAQAYTTIGNVYFRLNDMKGALTVFEKGLEIARNAKNQFGEALLLNNIGNVYERLSDYNAAIQALEESLALKSKLGDRWGEGHSLVTIGDCYISQALYKKALPLYKKSLSIRRALSDKPGMTTSLLALACTLRLLNNPDESMMYLKEVVPLCDELKDLKRRAEMHREYSLTSEALGDLNEALRHERLYHETREALLNEEVIDKTKKLNIIHNVAQMQKEREIYRLKAEQMELELAHKKRELVSLAMNLVQKNELVEKLKTDLNALSKAKNGTFDSEMKSVIANLEKVRSDEKSWSLFEQQFESVHQSFIYNLTQRFPELTKMEIRLCVLLKIQLSTKEIANLLFISPRSVETYRLRLRKKLGISGETNLVEFFLSFS